MEHIEDKLWLYSQLPPEERLDVEVYVQKHPELAPTLQEAKALGLLLTEARALDEALPSEDVLAYYVATEHFHGQPPPPALRASFARIQSHIDADPPLRERYETVRERIQRLLAASSDPLEQFERLAGYHLEAAGPPAAAAAPSRAAPSRVEPAAHSDRPPAAPLRRRWGLYAAVAVALLVGVYLALFAASRASQTELDRLAQFETSELMLETAAAPPSADGPEAASAQALYARALALLRNARLSTLGLFPRYDAGRLAEASVLLSKVVGHAEPDPYLRLEAAYLLGKTRLALGDVPGAREALQVVVLDGGERAPEAQRILAALEEV